MLLKHGLAGLVNIASAQSADINIVQRAAEETAPEGFVFEITNFSGFDTSGPGAGVYDPQNHDLYYLWDFDDDYTFTAPENTPTVHKNAGIAYGPWAAHTYRATGTYEPTCLVYEPSSGKFCTARLTTTTITVADPNTTFATTDTIFMSPSGDFADAPSGALTATSGDITTTLETGYSIEGQQTVPKRIMLNRGESYTFRQHRIGLNAPELNPTLHIVAGTGAGARPEVTATGAFDWNDTQNTGDIAKDFVTQNVNWSVTTWDSETDPAGSSNNFFGRSTKPPQQVLFDQCNFSGFNNLVGNAGVGTPSQVTINDCIVTNHAGYGVIDENYGSYAITGSKWVGLPNAFMDATGAGNGAMIRLGGGVTDAITIVDACDLFNRQGSTGVGIQGCLRLNTNMHEGAKTITSRCAIEGGDSLYTQGQGTGGDSLAANSIIEKNYMVGGYRTANMINVKESGLTIRNNIFVFGNQNNRANFFAANNPTDFAKTNSADFVASNLGVPVSFYNNTCVNVVDAAVYPAAANAATLIGSSSGNLTIVSGNNINHQTAITTPTVADAPLADTANDFFATRELGWLSTAEDHRSDTFTLTTAGHFDDYTPLTGSAALADVTGVYVAYDDFYGNVRPATKDRGAIQVST